MCCCIVHVDYTDDKDVLCVVVLFMETILIKKTCFFRCMSYEDFTVEQDVTVVLYFIKTAL